MEIIKLYAAPKIPNLSIRKNSKTTFKNPAEIVIDEISPVLFA
jgi:hypothetical protein